MPSSSSAANLCDEHVDPTSWRLLQAARRGDSSAIGQLISRCLPDLRRWAHGRLPRWVRTAADTSDLIQDVVARTLRRLDAFEPRGRQALAAYLREAVRNRIRDEHRTVARSGIAGELPGGLRSREPSALDVAMAAEVTERYRSALECLGARDREIVVAHVELDYTHEQLGCMIGRSPNAARMALRRAVGRLAERMREG